MARQCILNCPTSWSNKGLPWSKGREDRRFWLSKGALDNALRGAFTVLDEKPGAELEGWTYDGPFDELPAQQESGSVAAHRVVLWDEVGEAEGTGIVHMAPGCGAEDFELGRELGLPSHRAAERWGHLSGWL